MNISEFLFKIKEELEIESNLTEDTEFKTLPEWDSLNAMVLIGFFSRKFNISINALDIDNNLTLGDLFKLTKEKK